VTQFVATLPLAGGMAPSAVVTPSDRLALTFVVALLMHGALILGVSFVAPERVPPEYLDVILVQQADPHSNPEARQLAQAHAAGGGEEAQALTPSAPFEALQPAPTPEVVSAPPPAPPPLAPVQPEPVAPPPELRQPAVAPAPEPLPEPAPEAPAPPTEAAAEPAPAEAAAPPPPVLTTEAPAREAAARSRADSRREPAGRKEAKAAKTSAAESPAKPPDEPVPVAEAAAPAAPAPSPSAATLISQSFATAGLNAEIQQKLESRAERPRRKFISANTREYKYAAYMEAWRAKVERVGNLNYPEKAREKGLSGALILDVALRPDGTVEDIIVRKSSGHRELDDAAVRIVELAAPFAPFPRDFLDEVDVLHVTRTWQFMNNYRFSSGR